MGMPPQPLQESTLSWTEDHIIQLFVSPEFLTSEDRVVIVDDFLTTAQTILALARLARAGGAQIVGVGAVIEKTYKEGRANLQMLNVPIETLVQVERVEDGYVFFRD
jgi:xanthine phosphoribosyltransferase